ncbi:hypothetical protein K432DRAFT_230686 [Lepidopterella palustris CBS 459.81]|uniref:Uncharacterized protein n=1 Tax=Lepidopterella palustris CBS 459.81 TaxID=1314670 RepID=A0A8E2JH74_9PEZI|nr:hypothetical protein K432DRAFT_230686 [Lepidopterella palustris CBS 459.81]
MPAAPSEADIIFNRASVALAKSQRLIASWLPPKTAEELANAKSEEEIEREEKEIFTPVPELLGVGAPLPKDITDGSFKRRELSSNDKLLQQLLGKKAAKAHMSSKVSPKLGSKPLKAPPHQEDSEDEEQGRASAFKSKKQNTRKTQPKPTVSQITVGNDDEKEKEGPLVSVPFDVVAPQSPNSTAQIASGNKRPRAEEVDSSSASSDLEDEVPGMNSPNKVVLVTLPVNEGPKPKPANFLDQKLADRSKPRKKKKIRKRNQSR